MMDKAVRAGDAAEKALERRMRLIYRAALQTALERQAAFFEMVKDVQEGRKLPHPYYDTPEAIERWKQRFLIELARQQHVIDQIAEELAKAGVKCSSAIKRVLPELYDENREYTLGQTGVARENFAIYDKRQLETILKDEQSPFSKIAYKNLGKKKPIVARLGNELAASIMTGESQDDLLKRIQKVTGQSLMQARRVAQTERVRIQSQARADAITEAAQMGINMAQTWTARHVNTRDAHEFLHGKTIMAGQTFEVDAGHDVISRSKKGIRTGGGYEIAFPGDPNAPARAVINCHCVLVPRVLKPGEMLPGMDQQQVALPVQPEPEQRKPDAPTIAGVQRGEPMSYAEADSHAVNPNYGNGFAYSINCQTCVAVFEARRRGYNVIAKGNTKGSALERLSHDTRLIWKDTAGNRPAYVIDKTVTTPKKCLDWLKNVIDTGGHYTIQFAWKGRSHSGHIVNIEKEVVNGAEVLRIKDNQRGKGERDEWVGDQAVLAYLGQMKYISTTYGIQYYAGPRLLRIDNCDFDYDMADDIMEAAKK